MALTNGEKYWRLKYRSPLERNKAGKLKEKPMALGVYPTMRLPDARAKREEAKKLLANGRDPMVAKQEAERTSVAAENTFEAVGREWFAKGKQQTAQ